MASRTLRIGADGHVVPSDPSGNSCKALTTTNTGMMAYKVSHWWISTYRWASDKGSYVMKECANCGKRFDQKLRPIPKRIHAPPKVVDLETYL